MTTLKKNNFVSILLGESTRSYQGLFQALQSKITPGKLKILTLRDARIEPRSATSKVNALLIHANILAPVSLLS